MKMYETIVMWQIQSRWNTHTLSRLQVWVAALALAVFIEDLSIYGNMTIGVIIVLTKKILIGMQALLFQSLTVFPLGFG